MKTILQNAWLIPVVPIVMAGLLALVGHRLREPGAGIFALCAAGFSFLLTLGVFVALVKNQGNLEHGRAFVRTLYEWVPAGGFSVGAAFRVDGLSAVMMLLVTGVGSLIHLYAVGYMHGDRDFTRFFSYLNLFLGSMLILVMGDNFLVMFVGWELVGACSYLLVGFWYENMENSVAAKKAFVTNRVGDFGFVIGLMLIFVTVGSLDFTQVFGAANAGMIQTGTATAICLLLLVGATGKSAQIPLYVWLPDAMAGPTPVSAMLHAATMVTAGVYMIARSTALFDLAPAARFVVTAVGVGTALFAGTIALGQGKVKKVLAYSTISQLGYMIAGVGIGGAGIVAGIFHLLTHGFFKALLFLCAGSVMHGMHNEERMSHLGGLRKKMPITAATFLVGVIAISGIPPLSGFWSKDAILGALYDSHTSYGKVMWAIGLLAAFLTAVYMFRVYFLTFWGKPQWDEGVHPHESPATMTVPLVALAVLAVIGGVIDLPGSNLLHDWLHPVLGAAGGEAESWTPELMLLLGASTLVALAGTGLAWYFWFRSTAEKRASVAEKLGPIVGVVQNKYYVDEGIQAAIERPGYELCGGLMAVDEKGVDAALVGVGKGVVAAGGELRKSENGYVRTYAAVLLIGTVVLVTYVVLRGGLGL